MTDSKLRLNFVDAVHAGGRSAGALLPAAAGAQALPQLRHAAGAHILRRRPLRQLTPTAHLACQLFEGNVCKMNAGAHSDASFGCRPRMWLD